MLDSSLHGSPHPHGPPTRYPSPIVTCHHMEKPRRSPEPEPRFQAPLSPRALQSRDGAALLPEETPQRPWDGKASGPAQRPQPLGPHFHLCLL